MPGTKKDTAALAPVISVVEGDVVGSAPLNFNSLARWGGVIVSIVLACIGVVWQIADMRSDMRTKDLKITTLEKQVADVDKASLDRHNQQQREIDRNVQRQDQSERNLADLARKLDVAVAILERLDKRLGEK